MLLIVSVDILRLVSTGETQERHEQCAEILLKESLNTIQSINQSIISSFGVKSLIAVIVKSDFGVNFQQRNRFLNKLLRQTI